MWTTFDDADPGKLYAAVVLTFADWVEIKIAYIAGSGETLISLDEGKK